MLKFVGKLFATAHKDQTGSNTNDPTHNKTQCECDYLWLGFGGEYLGRSVRFDRFCPRTTDSLMGLSDLSYPSILVVHSALVLQVCVWIWTKLHRVGFGRPCDISGPKQEFCGRRS